MHKLKAVYTILLSILSIAFAIGSIWVVTNLDPEAKDMNIVIFYTVTSLFILFFSTLILFFFRSQFGVREKTVRHFYVSLRQGTLIGLLYSVSMFLQSKQLFTGLTSIFLILALTFLESYFIYNERKSQPNQS